MACSYYCPNCGENLGKDVEVPKQAWCGRCGTESFNEYGDDDD